jgi:outer membrane protein assembly factor BamB
LYIGGYDSNFYALSSEGTLKWQYNVDYKISSSAAISNDGSICLCSSPKLLLSFNSYGSLKWTFGKTISGFSSPVIYNDTIIFSCGDTNIHALSKMAQKNGTRPELLLYFLLLL